MTEMECNRVWRPFVGGKLLDAFCGVSPGEDGHYPERWICSTTRTADGKGVSRSVDGRMLTQIYPQGVDVLVKLLDSHSRLMIQVHPDDRRAQKYFSSPVGKTECWYVLDTRVIDGQQPYVYLGFRPGITRQHWQELYRRQDVAGMEQCLHKIPVKPGDAFFIPGGMVHAMGTGVFFAEIQQPTDITLRTERCSPDGRVVDDAAIHGGAGEQALFDCFDYGGCTREEILQRCKIPVSGEEIVRGPLFRMKDMQVEKSVHLTVEDYAIVLVLEGENKGKEYFLTRDADFTGPCRLLVCGGGEGEKV